MGDVIEFPPPIYRSEFCEVNFYTPNYPDLTPSFYIGNADESYDSPNWPNREAMIADLEAALAALKASACLCTNVYLNSLVEDGGGRRVVGKNWNPDCPVHPWTAAMQEQADRAVDLQRQAAEARRKARGE